MFSRIAGTGMHVPERVLTNADLEEIIDTTADWIKSRSGIERRRIAAEHESTSDLGVKAAAKALEASGIAPADIDFLVVGTTTPDLVIPNMGCLIQDQLGVPVCPAFSIDAACTGFIYALSVADRFVASGQANCALVVGADIVSRITNWKDRSTCVLFGDGAGAVVLQPAKEAGIISTHLRADGGYKELLNTAGGISSRPDMPMDEALSINMRGNETFKIAVKSLESIVEETLDANEMDRSEIDWLIPHQANHRIIEATAKRLGMSMDKVVMILSEYGNTSAASVPMALDVAVRDGRVKRGDVLLLEAFGGGLSWGSALVRY
jgi:3-oxoacyl-[acyl-carrier-protein] synthase-3